MTTHDILALLWRSTLISSGAICIVLALRIAVRRWLGAQAAYLLWMLVPCAAIAATLPPPSHPLTTVLQIAPEVIAAAPAMTLAASAGPVFDAQPWLLSVWIVGAIGLLIALMFQQLRYVHSLGSLVAAEDGALRAQGPVGSPALVGALRPRIVLPQDFDVRFDARERELILAHERGHLARGDAQVNALVALLRCLNWFNPLFHFAASRLRFDQELACDALVVARFPEARRPYADAMLKAQLVGETQQQLRLPAGCYWPSTHPLKERIAMLKSPVLTPRRRAIAYAAVMALSMCAGYASWAAQPSRLPVAPAIGSGGDAALIQVDLDLRINGEGMSAVGLTHDGVAADAPPGQWVEQVAMPVVDASAPVLRVDDKGTHFITRAGESFEVRAHKDSENWELDGAATPSGDGTFEFRGLLKHNGVVASKPSLVVFNAARAVIQVGDDGDAGERGFEAYKLGLTFTQVAGPLSTHDAGDAPVAALASQDKGLIRLGEIVNANPSENITYRKMEPPVYPLIAVRAGVGASVVIKVLVDAQGQAQSAEIEKLVLTGKPKPDKDGVTADRAALDDAFTKTSIAAAMSWKYNAGIKDGKPSSGYAFVPIDFSVQD